MDQPGERRSHAMATPRGGGIAIVVAVLLGIAWLAAASSQRTRCRWWSCALGLVLVAGIGWMDDHRPLPAWPRLMVQALAASTAGRGRSIRSLRACRMAVLAFVLVMVLVNVWNFMDGIDGLAASQAAIAAAGLALADGLGPWAWLGAGLFACGRGIPAVQLPQGPDFPGGCGQWRAWLPVGGLLIAGGCS